MVALLPAATQGWIARRCKEHLLIPTLPLLRPSWRPLSAGGGARAGTLEDAGAAQGRPRPPPASGRSAPL